MSKRKDLQSMEEQKCLLISKADLQRSSFLMITSPIFRILGAVEAGFFAVRSGKAILGRFQKKH